MLAKNIGPIGMKPNKAIQLTLTSATDFYVMRESLKHIIDNFQLIDFFIPLLLHQQSCREIL